MGGERDHATVSAGYTQKPGQRWTRSPEGSFLHLSLSLSLTVIPAPPFPPTPLQKQTQRHMHAIHTHTQSLTHTHSSIWPEGLSFSVQ